MHRRQSSWAGVAGGDVKDPLKEKKPLRHYDIVQDLLLISLQSCPFWLCCCQSQSHEYLSDVLTLRGTKPIVFTKEAILSNEKGTW